MLLFLLGCGRAVHFDDPIPVDDTFPRAEPTAAQAARFADAAAYSEAHAGRAVMVLSGGSVVFETGQNGHDLSEPNALWSGTKTFSCALYAFAHAEGTLDLDEVAADTLTEWAGDARKERITTRHLLQFTSGLREDRWNLTRDAGLAHPRVDDKYAWALEEPADTEPGAAYDYNGTHLLAFGALFERKTGEDPVDFLQARLFDPLGMRFAGWERDPAGNPMLAFGAWTTANEWLKFGAFLRDDGAWQGEALLPPGALDECLAGSEAQPAYGLATWLNADVTAEQADLVPGRGFSAGRLLPSAPADTFMAAGYNDNRLYVIPSEDLVIVRLGDGSVGWRDDAFLARVLGG